ncbi:MULTISPECIES: hypothetical protein [unclassified Methanosarcina]|uniref:hypothetical protein n=1 Tax=unclassified Methanosarcina TaxID=2644672 RepID=UPI00138E0E01|nr:MULTISPECIES: hypothetical protein [unclassified Methanosarcina]
MKKEIVEPPVIFEHILHKKEGGQILRPRNWPFLTLLFNIIIYDEDAISAWTNHGNPLSRFINKVYYRGRSISKWG